MGTGGRAGTSLLVIALRTSCRPAGVRSDGSPPSTSIRPAGDIYAALGEKDRALDALDQAADIVPQRVAPLTMYPEMALLRDDPRFAGVRESSACPGQASFAYQSTFAPIRGIRGDTMLSGRRKDPDDQFVFCSGLALNTLKRSTNMARRVADRRRNPFSRRTSRMVTLSIRRVSIGSARIRTVFP